MSNLFLGLLEEALTVAPDQQIFSPYLLWLRGELRLKNNSEQDAEEDLKEAIACARLTGGNFMNCEQLPVWRGSSRHRANAVKRAQFSPRYTTGSPRASTPPT
jgi:hypothetical protein